MGFFSRKQKKFAKEQTYYDLLKGYEKAEKALQKASCTGDKKVLNTAMKEHRKYEYALLYRNTPEFKRKDKYCR